MDTTVLVNGLKEGLKELFSKLWKGLGDEVMHLVKNHLLEYQVEEYSRNYRTKTLLHRLHPKPLKEFYQPLHIRKRKQRGLTGNIFDLRIPTISAEVLFIYNCITLIGDAGSGKSTIVRYLFLDCIDSNFKVPIKIELRYLNDYEDSLSDYIKEKVFRLQKLATADHVIERLLCSGNFVFFLDGYDELRYSKKEKVTKEIDELVKLYPENCFLITSRPHTEIELLPQFHNYEVCELAYDEIFSFVRKQFPGNEGEFAEKIIDSIERNHYGAHRNFLSNPLLLSMFVLTFQSFSGIPLKRSEFYRQVFDALYSGHDSMSKLAFVRERHSGLTRDQILDLLRMFSFLSFFEEKSIFSSEYFARVLNFIKTQKDTLRFDNERITYDLLVSIGIMKMEGIDLAFPHRSLQEYFAASYICCLNEENKAKVYRKLFEAMFVHGEESSRRYFFELLAEMDETTFIKQLFIPMLQLIREKINSLSGSADWNNGVCEALVVDLWLLVSQFDHIIEDDHGAILSSYRLRIMSFAETATNPAMDGDPANLDGVFERLKCWVETKLYRYTNFIEKEEKTEFSIISIIDRL